VDHTLFEKTKFGQTDKLRERISLLEADNAKMRKALEKIRGVGDFEDDELESEEGRIAGECLAALLPATPKGAK
jgi:hypothetical protein